MGGDCQMSSRVTERRGPGILVETWRDGDVDTRDLDGMAGGAVRLAGSPVSDARELYAAGMRHVRIPQPVCLCGDGGADALATLMLLREFTARGFAVEWETQCEVRGDDAGRLGHLHPPVRSVVEDGGSVAATRAWRERYFPGKCVFRYGPGFVEVRDRRFGSLELLTLDNPDYVEAVDRLVEGTLADSLPNHIREELSDAHLIAEHAGLVWWLPTRLYRWPFPSWAL
jgi:hypothetical protein